MKYIILKEKNLIGRKKAEKICEKSNGQIEIFWLERGIWHRYQKIAKNDKSTWSQKNPIKK